MGQSKSKRRSIVPGALVVAGLVGLGIAAASELDLVWGGTFQAGAVEVTADCQVQGEEIGVAFSAPYFVSSRSIPWTVDDVVFSDIPTDCQAAGMEYQAAYRTASTGSWVELGDFAAVDGATLNVELPSAVDPQAITEFALTIQSPAAG